MALADKLNFSSGKKLPLSHCNPKSRAIKLHNRNRDYGYYYDNLCLYCANNYIDVSNVTDFDLNSCADIMQDFGVNDISTDHYYFWID